MLFSASRLPNPGIEPASLVSLPLAGRFFTTRSPGVGNGNPLQYSCLENFMNKKSLAGCSPWGHKELAMTEHAHTHTHTHARARAHAPLKPAVSSAQGVAEAYLLKSTEGRNWHTGFYLPGNRLFPTLVTVTCVHSQSQSYPPFHTPFAPTNSSLT